LLENDDVKEEVEEDEAYFNILIDEV